MKTIITAAFILWAGSATAQSTNLDNGIPASCDSPMANDIITNTINSYLEQTNPTAQVTSIRNAIPVYIQPDKFSCVVYANISGDPPQIIGGNVEGVMGANGSLYTRFIDMADQAPHVP